MKYMNIPAYFSRFPVSGKKPLVDWGAYSKRLPTQEELNSWGGNKEWGIATGKVSNLLVLDDDGSEELKKYSIPKTLTQVTPRGGKHYFFRWTPELDSKVTTRIGIIPKADARGEGGYAVFYGFEKPFHMQTMALPPKWLIDLLPDRERKATATQTIPGWLEQQLNSITPGEGQNGRTPTFVRVIGRLKNQGMSIADTVLLLQPWADKHNFTEINELVADQFNRYPQAALTQELNELISFGDFIEEAKEQNWLVEGLLAETSISFFAGLPKAQKTWVLMDLAIEAARGGMWLGKFPVKKAKVLYIDQERGPIETARRLKAMSAHKEIGKNELNDTLKVKAGSKTRLNLEHSYQALRKQLEEYKPDLVIVDSFVTFSTGDVVTQASIGPVLERVKELRQDFGCAFAFIYHERKTAFHDGQLEQKEPSFQDMVGSVFIASVAEHCFSIRKDSGDGSFMYHTANNLGDLIEPVLIKVVNEAEDKSKISVKAY